ncbi:hypothetical protein W97_05391 [Coniosporium apollinis CBS 100218]|uniref:NAD(P)-binding protein n=1 Tax=Coniosporium apollinis (strain CBS 100218) TaxID=1168221 RepID=R7YWD6_CONA1|nr:uncharacterized protein W97_05391 [Coniosporium apollinis CBS 100218]EON66148.1 hypothetical protein W97_05391 [Coniosporium apollinis CBS 100218]
MAHLITGNKFDPNTDIPDLSGKTYIVTGGTAGIGFGISAHLLQHNPTKLIMISKKEEHGQEAIEGLKKYGDVDKVQFIQCDFEDLKSVDKVAKELSESLQQLDGLICNAGLGVGPYNETVDGIDSHMQVNHISQFHLTLTLLHLLQKTPNSRLAFQSSDLHRAASSSIKFASLDEINTDIGATNLYNRTKLANVLFVRALVRRQAAGDLGFNKAAQAGPYINATHPGAVSTDQQEQAIEAYGKAAKLGVKIMRPFMKSPEEEGCRPMLFAATSEDVVKEGINGAYIVPDRKVTDPSKQAQDEELGEQLWRLTEQILSEKLDSLPYRTQYIDPMAKEGMHGQSHAR